MLNLRKRAESCTLQAMYCKRVQYAAWVTARQLSERIGWQPDRHRALRFACRPA